MANIYVPVGPSIMQLVPGPNSFQVGTPATPSAGSKPLLNPNWTAGPTDKDPYRPWNDGRPVVLENTPFFANGWEQPWLWDGGSNNWQMGSTVPTTGAGVTTGGSGWLADGATATYYFVFREVTVEGGLTTIKKETAPQTITVTNSSGVGQDVQITWTKPTTAPNNQFVYGTIYRQLASTGSFVHVADTAVATATYTDTENDAAILNNTAYKERFRTTLPPIFKGMASHLNRLWGWTGLDSNLYYSQVSDPGGEFVVDDFPSGNITQIGPHDGDVIMAVIVAYGAMHVVKKRAAYIVEGTDPNAFTVRQLFADRGTLSARTVVPIGDAWFMLDERGIYVTNLAGEPVVAGASQDTRESPLQPTWDRLNRDAADYFWARHDEELGVYELHVALDHDPVPNKTIRFDYRTNRFWGVDDGVVGVAGGELDDSAGREHGIWLDELNNIWEANVGDADGVFAGTTRATVTSVGTLQELTASAATFDTTDASGGWGSPLERTQSDGTIVDEANRVFNVTATVLTPLYWNSTTPVAGDRADIGGIRFLFEIPRTNFGIEAKKHVSRFYLLADVETDGTLRVDTKHDEASYVNQREISLDGEKGHLTVEVQESGFRWQVRGQARYAGDDVTIYQMDIQVRPMPGARL